MRMSLTAYSNFYLQYCNNKLTQLKQRKHLYEFYYIMLVTVKSQENGNWQLACARPAVSNLCVNRSKVHNIPQPILKQIIPTHTN